MSLCTEYKVSTSNTVHPVCNTYQLVLKKSLKLPNGNISFCFVDNCSGLYICIILGQGPKLRIWLGVGNSGAVKEASVILLPID